MEATLETRKASDDTPEEKAKSIRIEDINGIRILKSEKNQKRIRKESEMNQPISVNQCLKSFVVVR